MDSCLSKTIPFCIHSEQSLIWFLCFDFISIITFQTFVLLFWRDCNDLTKYLLQRGEYGITIRLIYSQLQTDRLNECWREFYRQHDRYCKTFNCFPTGSFSCSGVWISCVLINATFKLYVPSHRFVSKAVMRNLVPAWW